MLKIRYEKNFKKDFRRVKKRGYDTKLFEDVVTMLVEQKTLPEKYREHNLVGEYSGCKECHITPDWLLIYRIHETESDRLYVMRLKRKSQND